MRVLRHEERGINRARNAGIAATTAPKILFTDADDIAANNRGVGLMGQFDYAEAYDVFAALDAAHPEWADIKVNLAIAVLNRQVEGDEALALGYLEEALALSDMIAVVATPEKYVDADLFRMLGRYRRGRAFVFILNRLDLGVPEEIARDLMRELGRSGIEAPRVFRISALAAGRARADGAPLPAEAGDFQQLEALIEHELTRTRIRRIKQANLLGLTRALLPGRHRYRS